MMVLRALSSGLALGLVCLYSLRAGAASELELTALTTALSVLMMLPQLRGKLIRRRLWVNVWMKQGASLTRRLQGGPILAGITLCQSLPWALLLVVELINLSRAQALLFSGLVVLISLIRDRFDRGLRRVLDEVPASLFAREWAARVYWGLGALCLIPLTLYQLRPALRGLALEEALSLSSVTGETGGIFGVLHQLAALKELSFWWFIENIDLLLSGRYAFAAGAARIGAVALYLLYALSMVYSFTRLVSAILELTDPVARRFFGLPAPTAPNQQSGNEDAKQ